MRVHRRDVFNPRVRGTYHVYSRCVRKSFLLDDGKTDRRGRLLEILEELASIYAIAVLASAFLSNHFHLILVNLPELVDRWSDHEVMLRAQRAFPHRFARQGIHGPPNDKQMEILLRDRRQIKEMRRRLSDISWMMRLLKQRFAAEMNQITGDEGHFWAGRFKMVEIKSEVQLITTMIYIALNQVKAGQASTLDTSFWTSVCWQVEARGMWLAGDLDAADKRAGFLSPLSSIDSPPPKVAGGDPKSRRASDAPVLEISTDEFVRLVNCARDLSRGARSIPSETDSNLMEQIDISATHLALAAESPF